MNVPRFSAAPPELVRSLLHRRDLDDVKDLVRRGAQLQAWRTSHDSFKSHFGSLFRGLDGALQLEADQNSPVKTFLTT
jgi:hypothetical protein